MVDARPAISPWREFAPGSLVLLAILSGLQRGVGFVLVLLAPLLLVWFVRMAFLAGRRPARRRAQAIKAGVIALAVLAALLVQAAWQRHAREAAQNVVDAVSTWHARHGTWPDDLAQAGLDATALRRGWRITYLSLDGRHVVRYAATFTVFDSYGYDLDHPGWVFHAD